MSLLTSISAEISDQVTERQRKVNLAVYHVKASVTCCNRFLISKAKPAVGVYSLGYLLIFGNVPVRLWELFFFFFLPECTRASVAFIYF